MGQNISAQTTLGSKDLMAELAAYYDRNYYANDSTVPYDRQYRHNVFQTMRITLKQINLLANGAMNFTSSVPGEPDDTLYIIPRAQPYRSFVYKGMRIGKDEVDGSFFRLDSTYAKREYHFMLSQDNNFFLSRAREGVDVFLRNGVDNQSTIAPNSETESDNPADFYMTINDIFPTFRVPHMAPSFRTRGLNVVSCVINSLNKENSALFPIIRDFKDDFLYPIQVTFEFDDKTKKGFVFFKNKSNEFYFVSVDFLKYWITNFK